MRYINRLFTYFFLLTRGWLGSGVWVSVRFQFFYDGNLWGNILGVYVMYSCPGDWRPIVNTQRSSGVRSERKQRIKKRIF